MPFAVTSMVRPFSKIFYDQWERDSYCEMV